MKRWIPTIVCSIVLLTGSISLEAQGERCSCIDDFERLEEVIRQLCGGEEVEPRPLPETECSCTEDLDQLEWVIRRFCRQEAQTPTAASTDLSGVSRSLEQLIAQLSTMNQRLESLDTRVAAMDGKVGGIAGALGTPSDHEKSLLTLVEAMDRRVAETEATVRDLSGGLLTAQNALEELTRAVELPSSDDDGEQRLGQVIAREIQSATTARQATRTGLGTLDTRVETMEKILEGVATGTDSLVKGVQDLQTAVGQISYTDPAPQISASMGAGLAAFERLEGTCREDGVQLVVESRPLPATAGDEIYLSVSLVDASMRAPTTNGAPWRLEKRLALDLERRVNDRLVLPWGQLDELSLSHQDFGLTVSLFDGTGDLLAFRTIRPRTGRPDAETER